MRSCTSSFSSSSSSRGTTKVVVFCRFESGWCVVVVASSTLGLLILNVAKIGETCHTPSSILRSFGKPMCIYVCVGFSRSRVSGRRYINLFPKRCSRLDVERERDDLYSRKRFQNPKEQNWNFKNPMYYTMFSLDTKVSFPSKAPRV